MSYKKFIVKGISILLLLMVAGSPILLMAQQEAQNLFTPVFMTESDFSGRQAQLMQTYQSEPTTLEINLVQVQSNLLKTSAIVNLNVFPGEDIVLVTDRVETRGKRDFSWFAQSADGASEAILVVDGDDMVGTIRSGQQLYSVQPLGDGVQAVIRVDPSAFPEDHPPEYYEELEPYAAVPAPEFSQAEIVLQEELEAENADQDDNAIEEGLDIAPETEEKFSEIRAAEADETTEAMAETDVGLDIAEDIEADKMAEAGIVDALSEELPLEQVEAVDAEDTAPEGDPNSDNNGDQASTITVLVAYTPMAQSQTGNINALIQLAIDEANQSYSNSQINPRLHLVHRYQTAYAESGNMITDRNRFRINGDGYMDEVHALRNTYAADVAVVITGNGGWCGYASAIMANASTAFAVVQRSCATGNYSFGHEIGHLQGARHNQQADPTMAPFPYGHGYYHEPDSWRTVMSYDCPSGCTRLQYWSNPNVSYGGVPMGTAALNNNARVLNETAAQVANFRTTSVGSLVEANDEFGRTVARGDFNGDGYVDLAIGVPREDIGSIVNAGAFNVLYSTPGGLSTVGTQLWHQNSAGVLGAAEAGDLFGAALAAGDFNNDGYDDLAIGVPGESIGSVAGAGAANVMFGSASGLTASGDQLWHQNTSGIVGVAETNDHFGYALAAGDFNGDGRDDLAIGVPDEDIGSINSGGAVNVLPGTASGLTAAGDQLWHQNSAGIGSFVEAGDRFGAALAVGDFNNNGRDDLAIGVPDEDIGSINSGGAVNVLPGTASGLTGTGSTFWHQNTPSVIGMAETNDHFGYALAAGDFNGDGRDDLAIGVPDEDIGSINSGGAVNVLPGTASGLTAAGDQLWHQNSAGIGSFVEAGDRFGAALAVGDFNNNGRDDLAVGVPDEDIGSINSGGAVNVLPGTASGLTGSGSQFWQQNTSGILGTAEAGDWFGAALAAGDFNGDGRDDLAIGVPGESIGTIGNGGAAHALYSNGGGLSSANDQLWHQNS